MQITYGIMVVSVLSPIIPLIISLGKELKGYQKTIVIFILTSFLSDLLSLFLIHVLDYSSIPLLHIYGFIEMSIILLFYQNVLRGKKVMLITLAIIFTVTYTGSVIYNGLFSFNTFGRTLESILVIFLSLRLFYQFFKNEDDIFLDRSPIFWINVGLLFYFSGAFFSFVMSQIVEINAFTWVLHNLTNAIKNLILAIAIWKVR